jgi:hypothetical protein
MKDKVTLRSEIFHFRDAEIELADDERIVAVETLGSMGRRIVWIANDRDRFYQTAKLAADHALYEYDFSGVCGY